MPAAPSDARRAYRICPLCEATCGLELTLHGERVDRVEGHSADLLSGGFLCPKGANLANLNDDPDRLAGPLVRGGGSLRPATWNEAFGLISDGIGRVRERYGNNAVGVYVGNPNAHTLAAPPYLGHVIRALRSRSLFSPASADQIPAQVACARIYGSARSVPIPDIDRAKYLVVIGANPMVSNGSLCTAPNFPARLRALKTRGGRLAVVDPRRTATARMADLHLPIYPATDSWLLLGLVSHLLAVGRVRLGKLEQRIRNLGELRALVAGVGAEDVARRCGLPAGQVAEFYDSVGKADRVAVYGRIGTCTVEHGTLTNWLIQCVNILAGSLDRPGGAMFPISPVRPRHAPRSPFVMGRWHSRVRGLPEVFGELPVSTMVDEVVSPGEGQIRALVTIAGNPVLSVPQGGRLAESLSGLEFMMSVDPYVNETTSHAHVILPPPAPLSSGHFDWALSGYFVRAVVRYSRALRPLRADQLSEEDILCRLALMFSGSPSGDTPHVFRERLLARELEAATRDEQSGVYRRDPEQLRSLLTGISDVERYLEARLRLGPFGDAFGGNPEGLTLGQLLDHPEGLDFGPPIERIDEIIGHEDGCVDIFPPEFKDEAWSLRDEPKAPRSLALIGRRQLRSNNSWLHNVPRLVRGRMECTLVMNELDADSLGLAHGELVRVDSRTGSAKVILQVTTDIRRGAVSLPHGWGHNIPEARTREAAREPGVNVNELVDPASVDQQSGAAVMNGIPVTVTAARRPRPGIVPDADRRDITSSGPDAPGS
jgi:anaerobic selenocysteine-containing dehydrogenase